jgi:esterase/lipase
VCIVQGTEDRVVDPVSAKIAYEGVGTNDKILQWIESRRHGILNEDIGGIHALLLDFIGKRAGRINP